MLLPFTPQLWHFALWLTSWAVSLGPATDTKVNDKLIPYVVDVGANYPQAKPSCMNPRVPPQPHTEAHTARLVDVATLG